MFVGKVDSDLPCVIPEVLKGNAKPVQIAVEINHFVPVIDDQRFIATLHPNVVSSVALEVRPMAFQIRDKRVSLVLLLFVILNVPTRRIPHRNPRPREQSRSKSTSLGGLGGTSSLTSRSTTGVSA